MVDIFIAFLLGSLVAIASCSMGCWFMTKAYKKEHIFEKKIDFDPDETVDIEMPETLEQQQDREGQEMGELRGLI